MRGRATYKDELTLFTDGSCIDGCGGWGLVILQARTRRVLSTDGGAEPGLTTQHKMELLAVARGLELTRPNRCVLVKTDSKLVYDIFIMAHLGALHDPTVNELVNIIWRLMEDREVLFQRIRSGQNQFNRRAHNIAYKHAQEARRYVESVDLTHIGEIVPVES